MQTLRDLWKSLDRWGRYLFLALVAVIVLYVLANGWGVYLLQIVGML